MVPGPFFIVPGMFSWFSWSRLVFHGSRSVFMVAYSSRLVFSWFQVGFHGFSWFQVGFHGFSWFQGGFSWFFSKTYLPELYPGPTIHSRSAAWRAA